MDPIYLALLGTRSFFADPLLVNRASTGGRRKVFTQDWNDWSILARNRHLGSYFANNIAAAVLLPRHGTCEAGSSPAFAIASGMRSPFPDVLMRIDAIEERISHEKHL